MFGGHDPENCPFTPKRKRGLGAGAPRAELLIQSWAGTD